MRVSEIFEERAAFSFEVFPPKTDVGMEKLCGEGGVLDQLYTLNPDYISCTYGAGGTNVGKNLEVLDKIKNQGFKYSTKSGLTVAVRDALIPANKQELIAQADAYKRSLR